MITEYLFTVCFLLLTIFCHEMIKIYLKFQLSCNNPSILLCQDATPTELRELVAGVITSQPEVYSAALLGKDPLDYIGWILKEDSWGGEDTQHLECIEFAITRQEWF